MATKISDIDEDASAVQDKKRPHEDASEEADDKRMKMTCNTDTFKCSICLNILHDAVSLSPCQHNFCNSCFSDWYKRNSAGCKCPQCRQPIVYVNRNHTIRNLVEELLVNYPSLKRPADEIAEMEKGVLVKTNFVKLSDILISFDEDDDDDEDDHVRCRQCPGSSSSASNDDFCCNTSTLHLTCQACFQAFPDRSDINVPQKCGVCQLAYCDAYWRSENILSTSAQAGCTANGRLIQMSQRSVSAIPRTTHGKNVVEQDITRQFIAQEGIQLQQIVVDWMTKFENREFDISGFPYITSSLPTCDKCADFIVGKLLDKFRLSIPKTQLPAASQRDDCWYGYNCRTQHHKPAHAQRLNHVCEPSRR